jgi:hypothetical protein
MLLNCRAAPAPAGGDRPRPCSVAATCFSSAKRRPWMMPDQTSAFIIFVHVRATFDLSHVRGLARIPFVG